MSCFRFRVLTRPPLPIVKAWFALPEDHSSAQIATTIHDLKRMLLDQFPALVHSVPNGANPDLLLAIDGFELLSSTSVRNVIKDGDLVT